MAGRVGGGARLVGLTAGQSQRVRDLARVALAERGLEAAVHADHLRLADGRTLGLENLASHCHNTAAQAWPRLIAAHLDALLSRYGAEPPELTVDQIRAGAHLRLVLPMDEDWYRYAPRIGEGFAELLVHRDGDFVRHLNDDDVARVGHSELREIGLANLRSIRPDTCELIRGDGVAFLCVRGASGFIASKLLILPEMVRIVAGSRVVFPHGVLVAVPSKYELAFAVVDETAETNTSAMSWYAAEEFARAIGPLSPHLYWWRDGRLTALSRADPSGRLTPALVPEFTELLSTLAQGPG